MSNKNQLILLLITAALVGWTSLMCWAIAVGPKTFLFTAGVTTLAGRLKGLGIISKMG